MNLKAEISVLIPDLGYHPDLAHDVANCLSYLGNVKIHAIANSKGLKEEISRLWSSYHFIENDQKTTLLQLITDIVKDKKIDVILPVTEKGIRIVSYYLNILAKLTAVAYVPPCDTFNIAVDKGSLVKFMQDFDFPHPHTIFLSDMESLSRQLPGMKFPVLLKPTRGFGGKGILFFNDHSSLLSFFKKHPDYLSDNFILQSFISGHDICCSLLCQSGKILAYTMQKSSIGNQRRFHKAIRFIQDEETLAVMRRLMAALSWNGIIHVDLRYDEHDKQIKVLEINPRYWASLMGSLAVGVNFPYLACLAALGKDFQMPQYELRYFLFTSAAVKQFAKKIFGQEGEFPLRWQDTYWQYMANDPKPFILGPILKIKNKLSNFAAKILFPVYALEIFTDIGNDLLELATFI